jgi:hypothetical protein
VNGLGTGTTAGIASEIVIGIEIVTAVTVEVGIGNTRKIGKGTGAETIGATEERGTFRRSRIRAAKTAARELSGTILREMTAETLIDSIPVVVTRVVVSKSCVQRVEVAFEGIRLLGSALHLLRVVVGKAAITAEHTIPKIPLMPCIPAENENVQILTVGLGCEGKKCEQSRPISSEKIPTRTDTLELILLLDCVRVGRSLGSVDEFVGKALGNGLDVPERRLTRARGQEPDGLVHPPQRRHINSLTPDGTSASDTSRVFPRAGVDDRVNQDLDGVLVREQVNDFESVLDDPVGHEFLAVVTAVHHEGVGEAFDDGALLERTCERRRFVDSVQQIPCPPELSGTASFGNDQQCGE